MDKLSKKLTILKEILEKNKQSRVKKTIKEKLEELKKAMKQGGLGGSGSVKAGAVLPSINKLPKPGNNSNASKTGMPGIAQPNKKDPLKVAEQTQNKDIKDIKMKEAQSVLKPTEMVKFEKNGQWTLTKGTVTELRPAYNAQVKSEKRYEAKNTGKDPLHKPAKNFKHVETEEAAKLTGGKKGWLSRDKGVSEAGAHVRSHDKNDPSFFLENSHAKNKHRQVLEDLKAQPKPNLTKADFPFKNAFSHEEKTKQLNAAYDKHKALYNKASSPADKKYHSGNLDRMQTKIQEHLSLKKDNSVKPNGENIYNATANIKRKQTRTSEVRDNIGQNSGVRQYSSSVMGSANQQASREAAKAKRKSSKMPVKSITLNPEEKAKIEARYNEKKGKS